MSRGKLILKKVLSVSAVKIFKALSKNKTSKSTKHTEKMKVPIVVDNKWTDNQSNSFDSLV